jgi:hypothetical protein
MRVYLSRTSTCADGYATVEAPGHKRRGYVRWQRGQEPRVGLSNSTDAERREAAFAVLGALLKRRR